MLTGLPLLVLILVVLVFIIIACAVWRWHPFPVLIVAALTIGLAAGMEPPTTLQTLLQGSGSVFASIGFIIALGTILGEALERTGAVAALASAVLKKVGPKRVISGMSLMGALVGIPVFCDSGFVILSNLARSLSLQASLSYGAVSIALATGLYTTHVLIPPTPGPLAVVGNFGMSADLGWVILMGLLVSLPAIASGYWFARQMKNATDPQQEHLQEEVSVPHAHPKIVPALIPLLLPVLLIALSSVLPLLSLPASLSAALLFICNPNIALLLGVVAALLLLGRGKRHEWNDWIQKALLQAGPIIFITAAGGALGAILKATPMAAEFETLVAGKNIAPFYFFPIAYLLAAGLKTAQGSSTAAMIIASSIIAPLLPGMQITDPAVKTLLLLSIGAGAMTVSHANDSYFWVINQYGKIPVAKMYRYFTLATFVMGITVLATCMLLSLLF